jgi:enoyl-CoA hydratase/carnithine racemase
VENGVYRIVFDRPSHRNAFSPTLYGEIKRGVLMGEGDPEVVCIVIEGSGGSFGAGGDLKVLLDILDEPRDERLASYIAAYHDTTPIGPMLECTKPIVSKIDGMCYAGGLLVALASDIAIASEGSTFGLPEAKVGLSDRYSASLLPRAIGLTRARYLTFTGELIDARKAEDWGLILGVVPAEELENEVQRVLGLLRRSSPDAIRMYKHSFNRDIHGENAMDFYRNLHSFNAQEGLRAFGERRAPIWQR